MDFLDYIMSYYKSKLAEYEDMNIRTMGTDSLLDVLREASTLKKFIYDNKEEGYEETYNQFSSDLNAIERLEAFLSRGLARLGGTEAQRFYLYPRRVINTFGEVEEPSKVFALNSYLDELAALTSQDLDLEAIRHSADPDWLAKTDLVLAEMTAFTRWLLDRVPADEGMIFLLRDALLPCLGVWQLRPGTVEAVPLLLSRKFLARFGAVFYRSITPPIYEIITKNPHTTYTELRQQYKQIIHSCVDPVLEAAIASTRSYLKSATDEGKTYRIIESGVQGSMPLFAGSIFERINGFLMYTTAPWLVQQYQEIIFRNNYNYLREMETLICQNHLLDFHSYRDGVLYIQEYPNQTVKLLSQYEIVTFKEMLGS